MSRPVHQCSAPDCNGKHLARGFCVKHYSRLMRHGDPSVVLLQQPPHPYAFPTLRERIVSCIRVSELGCWVWQRQVDADGYGRMTVAGRGRLAHRVSYEEFVGPVPADLTLDHLCRNTACVNPEHLEPVTNRENILRGGGPSARAARATHCIRGHEFAGENLLMSGGFRYCRACIKIRKQKTRAA